MKSKVIKYTLIGILVLVLAYATLFIADFIRLKSSEMYTKPLITISESSEQDGTVYSGLGYSVTYHTEYKTVEKNGTEMKVPAGGDAYFKLFGQKISSWTADSEMYS